MFGGRTRQRRGISLAGRYLYYFTIGVLVIAATGVLAVSIIPSLSFSSVALDRTGDIGVNADSAAVMGLDVATSVQDGSTDRLVTVTNNLAVPADITVSLNDPSQGTLYYGGSSVGSAHTVTLSPGSSAQFDVQGTISSGGSDWQSSDCSQPEATAQQHGWEVVFYCASYDASADQTQYKYSVTPIGTPGQMRDLSHVVFGFEDGFDPAIVSSSPEAESDDDDDDGDSDGGEVQTDPVTGVYGLKFGDELSKTGSGQTYTFTINGNHGTTSEDHGLKAGRDEFALNLPGPSSASGSAASSETIGFTVKSVSEELTGSVERSTTLEPSQTPTDTPTDTQDEDDDSDDGEDEDDGGPPDGIPGGGDDEDD